MKKLKKIISFITMSIVLVSCSDTALENRDWLQKPSFETPMTLTPSSENIEMIAGNDTTTAITFTWSPGNDRGAGTTLKYFLRMDILGNNFKGKTELGEPTVLVEEIPAGVFTKSYTVGALNDLLIERWGYPGSSIPKLEVEIIAQVEGGAQFQTPEYARTSFSAKIFSPGPLPLFMVGDAVGSGWNYNAGVKLNEVIERSQYTYSGEFSAGSFKIIDSPGSEWPSYNPKDASTLVYNKTDPGTVSNFEITKAGRYSLYINRKKLIYALAYTPYEKVFMVGNATPAGWDAGKAVPMIWDPKNPEVFTYTGILKVGEMKLHLDFGNWNGRNLMPEVGGTKISGNTTDDTRVKLTHGQPDDKWVIQTEGNYEITLNPAKMTIVFKKL
ncbi:SusF/SusE family outer membrane protein [Flavobacterium restrictum]|uniref:SusF/SusE family outer membrane protein n=1 Tax=Flavobacterium restrictum TaxID=2594428 RepID=A0A553E4P9_9FLAO|nr:SusF/SusE family outer membrane protein [Flavobacterium restrictum]TRX39997.1 SusF/SusE family outer membrane protein [Flavobacterium restrictum]